MFYIYQFPFFSFSRGNFAIQKSCCCQQQVPSIILYTSGRSGDGLKFVTYLYANAIEVEIVAVIVCEYTDNTYFAMESALLDYNHVQPSLHHTHNTRSDVCIRR